MNMAALWKLPVVYIIEKQPLRHGNLRSSALRPPPSSIAMGSLRIPGQRVDGMDVLAVRAAGEKAVDYARSGKGPYISRCRLIAIAAIR